MDKHAQYTTTYKFTSNGAVRMAPMPAQATSYAWLWIGLIICMALTIGALLYFGI